jgi:glycosyltransferase involved in cell wall biosynthesis
MSFSVVIPTFNSANSLMRALRALTECLNYYDLEIVVVDDCSIDNTQVIINEFRKVMPIKVHKNSKNMGASYSRNKGVELSTHKYIVFNDCDDISLQERFDVHSSHLIKGNVISFVSSSKNYGLREVDYLLSDEIDKAIDFRYFCRFILLGEKANRNTPMHFPAATMAISKTDFYKVGMFDNDMKREEDVDFLIRAFSLGMRISTSSVKGVIRQAGNSRHQSGRANFEGDLKLIDKYGKTVLSRWEIVGSKLWFASKADYFDRKLIRAIVKLPLLGLFAPKRLFLSVFRAFPSRIQHDFKNWIANVG